MPLKDIIPVLEKGVSTYQGKHVDNVGDTIAVVYRGMQAIVRCTQTELKEVRDELNEVRRRLADLENRFPERGDREI